MNDTVHSLREALAFYGNMQNWQDGGFTRTARNTMTLIMSTAMKDRGERARAALAAAPQPAPSHEDLLDKIDGLESELDSAVEVAIKRGAVEWGRLNYPNHPALKDAPQPDDEWPVIPDTPEERAYRKGWKEGMMAGHKLVPIDDPAAPHPAPAETDWGPDVGKEVLPAYQTTPADREALVDVVAEELRATLGTTEATWLAEDVADALLARGQRLPAPETMAWAVVDCQGAIRAAFTWSVRARHERATGERVVRVAIREVEGNDDAA